MEEKKVKSLFWIVLLLLQGICVFVLFVVSFYPLLRGGLLSKIAVVFIFLLGVLLESLICLAIIGQIKTFFLKK